ncbi:MAG: ABC transporter substrate-binding protein [Proteobacteria bacterium]|nr:ABC transporter substrate-binding protein [Pseudomonadota bacterium]MBU1582749.1 ABC transporter substrate-binding protein [Pseudomonadota bacterium]MBU2455296.1 ABC transporter substrate-binding protein [Pseudomonadota bacterium]MBU2627088.1 ABC transporter substrate-binding protein [Pseudomonadota bacterium]
MKNMLLAVLVLLATVQTGCETQQPKPVPEKVPVQLKWHHQAQFAGFYIAEKKGFYGAENIHVSLKSRTPGMSNKQVVDELVRGESLFAVLGGDSLLTERALGAPIVSIAVIFQRNPYAYATLKGSKIHRPQDFVGKKIMLPPDGKLQHAALMKKLGLSDNDIEYLPYDRDSDVLSTGKIDAQMVYRPGSGLALEDKGRQLSFIWVEDYGIRLYADTIVTTEKTIKEKPDLVEKFLRASLKGWRYAIENPEEAVAVTLAMDPALVRDQQMRMLKIQTPLIHTGEHQIGWMEQAVWQDMQKIFRISEDKLNINSAFSMEFLFRIYGRQE